MSFSSTTVAVLNHSSNVKNDFDFEFEFDFSLCHTGYYEYYGYCGC